MAKTALIVISLVAIVLAIIAGIWLTFTFPLPSDESLRVHYLEQYLGVAQLIVVGIVVTLVSVIIPVMLSESRDKFERYKESRQAYSRAKTAVLYLPDRVTNADQENAFRLVEEAHRELHLAETFEDVIIEKGHLKWFGNPQLWILYNYWQIVAVAEVLRSRTIDWDISANKNLLRDRIDETLEVAHRRFGRRGEACKGETWDIKSGSRFRKEDELSKHIRETANKPLSQ